MTIEEILQNVSGSSKYRDIYDKILSTDSLMSTILNQVRTEEFDAEVIRCLRDV